MDNVAGTVPVPLTVFGGAVTEMSPEDLPEGASPFNQDADFIPGATFTRGGRQSVYTFNGLFVDDLAGFAFASAGPLNPNEAPWQNPVNASLNIPGTYASVTVNTPPSTFVSPTFVQATATDAVAQSIVKSFVSNVAVGNTLIVFATATALDPTTIVTYDTMTDSRGTIYSKVATLSQAITAQMNTLSVWIGTAPSSGPNTVTGHISGGVSRFLMFTIMEYTPSSSFVFDGIAGSLSSGNPQTAVTGPITTTGTVDLLFGINVSQTTSSNPLPVAGAGYTMRNTFFENPLVGWAMSVEDRQATPAGSYTASMNTVDATHAFGLFMVAIRLTSIPTPPASNLLRATNFNFNLPIGEAIVGAEIEVSGHQTAQPLDAILTANLVLPNGTVSPRSITAQLPLVDGQIVIGSGTESWSLLLTPAVFNNPNLAAQLVASAAALQTFSIFSVRIRVFTSPTPGANFNYIKTYEQTSGQIDTLALDANGVLWDENVTATPNVLNGIFTGILPNTFAKSVTFENVEYIALSNLTIGTDIPRHWDGTNLDRVSQVGPGAPPSVNATATIFNIAPAPNGITQAPAVIPLHGGGGADGFGAILWSTGPGSTQSGNTITFFYTTLLAAPTPDPLIVVGQGIRIQGTPAIGGQLTTGNYIVTSVGSAVPPNGNFSNPRWYFTVTATSTQSGFFFVPNNGIAGSNYQVTLATLTTLSPLPNTQVGSQIQLAGVGVAAWNATWTVLATPNAGQLAITSTQLSGNVATYTFTLISGVAPTVGQQVTIVGCLNGPIIGGTSIFNISNGIVASTGANQFSIALTANNVNPAAENGNATVNGTKFQFDPGIQFAGTATNPIFGNSGGGTVVVGGAGLNAGVRKAVLMFLTRNNLITPCSQPVIFATTGVSTSLAFSNLAIGPPDTIARIIAMTGANGGNFFWIQQPTIIQQGGQNVTYTSSKISDNTSTSVVLTFTDAVLLGGTPIDVPGNNLFNQIEVGSCRGFLTYANRMILWGENNKIQNLINLSFEGGIGIAAGGVQTYPLGWTIDPINGAGGNLRVSPVFGNSYYVQNLTGGVTAFYGMIEQNAFQDPYQVPIVQPNLTYSARVTARCPSGVQTGNLVVDLFSPLQNRVFGSFTIPLSTMTSNFQIFTGTLLTAAFSTVPADLLYRIYATNLPNNGDVEVDRTEPFPTLQPILSTQMRASYANNQEAFDLVTGAFGPNQNQQPINGGFTLFDSLYALKEKSLFSTSDNGVTEPNQWNWREVSQKAGTIGINSYDVGEGWMITACRPGLYFFEGGEPIKISQEIQSVWDLINWKAGASIWVRNDEQLKRITIGVPIPTPNAFMPEFPVNTNPTSPNVILMCSYRELNTGQELAHTGPIRSTFSGRLMSPEPARKWSFWNIACPYADFINRNDENWPEFFCTGYQNSKVFQLSSAQLDDDGAAINSFYVTYGFVKPEMAEAKGLGLYGMELVYLTLLITGSGTAQLQVYPDSVQNQLPFQLDPLPLTSISFGDSEAGALITANRFFIRIGTNAIGSKWKVSKVVAALTKGAWSEIRGRAVGSAL